MEYTGEISEFCKRIEDLVKLLVRAWQCDNPSTLPPKLPSAWRPSSSQPPNAPRREYLRRAVRAYARIAEHIEGDSETLADTVAKPREMSPARLVYELFNLNQLNEALDDVDANIRWARAVHWSWLPELHMKIGQLKDADLSSNGSHDTSTKPLSPPLVKALTDTQQSLVGAVRKLEGASKHRVKKIAIAKDLGYKSTNSLDKPLAELVRLGLLKSTPGSKGGYSTT